MDQSPFVRMAPMQLGDLPDHPLFHESEPVDSPRPDLLPFLLALLDGGNAYVENKNFNSTFKHNSNKSAPPSKDGSEVLIHDVPVSTLEGIDWAATGIPNYQRTKPRSLQAEHWFARRSYHTNTSVKSDSSTAAWNEFIYGLRDNHSKHEQDFTPTLYDAHHILDWNDEISRHASTWNLATRGNSPSETGVPVPSYSNITLSVYEMCHALPWPLGPRCFPVLVATASTSPTRFIAVTVPVNLSHFSGAHYANGKNQKSGEDSQKRKDVVVGVYAAFESVELHKPGEEGNNTDQERIQWVMATASDARGNLPMSVQKSTMPSQVPKDITFFLNWIKTVDSEETKKVSAWE